MGVAVIETPRKLTKTVHFTAMSTMTANMGQANYIAANAYMDTS